MVATAAHLTDHGLPNLPVRQWVRAVPKRLQALWARHDAGEAIKGVALQRAAGLQCRADYFRNLKLIDWRLAPPRRNDFELELQEPEPAAFPPKTTDQREGPVALAECASTARHVLDVRRSYVGTRSVHSNSR